LLPGHLHVLDKHIPKNSIPVDEHLMNNSKSETLLRFINKLSFRERYIIIHSFGFNCEPMRLELIAERLDISRERVRQIRTLAINKLKTFKTQLKQQLS